MKFDIYERYIPSSPAMPGAEYVKNSEGDWYSNQKKFSENTLKVMVNEDGIIFAYTLDASSLSPRGFAVIEFDNKSVPDTLMNNGQWKVNDDGEIIKVVKNAEQMCAEVLRKKLEKLKKATEEISKLEDAKELNMSLPGDDERLIAWKKYRILVDRVDVLNPAWPAEPE